jgi:hypothetical protein
MELIFALFAPKGPHMAPFRPPMAPNVTQLLI